MTNEDVKRESATLTPCPFCGGSAEFAITKNTSAPLHIRHYPALGVCCPVRMDQYCDSFEQGRSWWNSRSESYSTLPNGLSREDAMQGLMSALEGLEQLEKMKDSSFVRFPDMHDLLNHINKYGLPPKDKKG